MIIASDAAARRIEVTVVENKQVAGSRAFDLAGRPLARFQPDQAGTLYPDLITRLAGDLLSSPASSPAGDAVAISPTRKVRLSEIFGQSLVPEVARQVLSIQEQEKMDEAEAVMVVYVRFLAAVRAAVQYLEQQPARRPLLFEYLRQGVSPEFGDGEAHEILARAGEKIRGARLFAWPEGDVFFLERGPMKVHAYSYPLIFNGQEPAAVTDFPATPFYLEPGNRHRELVLVRASNGRILRIHPRRRNDQVIPFYPVLDEQDGRLIAVLIGYHFKNMDPRVLSELSDGRRVRIGGVYVYGKASYSAGAVAVGDAHYRVAPDTRSETADVILEDGIPVGEADAQTWPRIYREASGRVVHAGAQPDFDLLPAVGTVENIETDRQGYGRLFGVHALAKGRVRVSVVYVKSGLRQVVILRSDEWNEQDRIANPYEIAVTADGVIISHLRAGLVSQKTEHFKVQISLDASRPEYLASYKGKLPPQAIQDFAGIFLGLNLGVNGKIRFAGLKQGLFISNNYNQPPVIVAANAALGMIEVYVLAEGRLAGFRAFDLAGRPLARFQPDQAGTLYPDLITRLAVDLLSPVSSPARSSRKPVLTEVDAMAGINGDLSLNPRQETVLRDLFGEDLLSVIVQRLRIVKMLFRAGSMSIKRLPRPGPSFCPPPIWRALIWSSSHLVRPLPWIRLTRSCGRLISIGQRRNCVGRWRRLAGG